MEMMVINPDADQQLRTDLETLPDGSIVLNNTLITIPMIFSSLANFGNITDAANSLGIDGNRINVVLRGLSNAFELLSKSTEVDDDQINAVARAWCHSIGLPYKPADRKARIKAAQFIKMLSAAGVEVSHSKKSLWRKVFGY
jgi:hypothetical protein